MKAVIHSSFGPPEELKVQEVPKPIPKDNEVLIKIHKTTVTSSDCNMRDLTFAPNWARLPYRLFLVGIFKPRIHRLGVEFAGEVEAVGEKVSRFEVGDKVFGAPEPDLGAHAEYICLPENRPMVLKPEGMAWEEAATLTLAGITALFYIRDLGAVQSGHKVLINGASGAIGTFAVQLAKYYGAYVTGVCSGENMDLVKNLGADLVIDYTREDFTEKGANYDIIFDVVNKVSYAHCSHVLNPQGIYLAGAGQEMLRILLTSKSKGKKAKGAGASPNIEDLEILTNLFMGGTLRTVIDRHYPLEEIDQAFRYVETGHKKGHVVIDVI